MMTFIELQLSSDYLIVQLKVKEVVGELSKNNHKGVIS